MKDKKAIPINEIIMARYPKIGFLAFVAIISELIPNAGIIIMYTSGWPKNQNKCWNNTGLPP